MSPLRSLKANTAYRRAHWRTLGLSEEDMLKPKIAVVNSSSELAVCYAHLDEVCKVVKEAVREAGGVPFEVRTTAPSDFITGAARNGSYILAGRELVTNDIEAQVEAALLDGMICLTSCDKTPPGQLMAAGRLNIPTILVIGGYQPHGKIGEEDIDVEELWIATVAETMGKPGKISAEDMSFQAIRGPGVCTGMATANTMHCVVEALGMCIPGSAPVRARSQKMFDNARAAAARIIGMVEEDLTPRKIMTKAAFKNAVATVLAVSGSINAIKHLQAVAVECESGVDIFALWDEMSRKVPVLTAVRPSGKVRLEAFEDAGGAAATLKRLTPVIDTSALTCTGKTLAENLKALPDGDSEIIRPLDRPISAGPSIAILKGSLAPESAVIKLGIRDVSRKTKFRGPAVVFDSGQEAIKAIQDGKIKRGDALVVRGMGLKGGPGMGGPASHVVFALDSAGMQSDVAFVSDGQLSGLCNKGLTIAETSPEAAVGGPLSLVETGDMIVIDVDKHQLDVDVPAEVLARRREAKGEVKLPKSRGYLSIYQRAVQDMHTGAVLVEEE